MTSASPFSFFYESSPSQHSHKIAPWPVAFVSTHLRQHSFSLRWHLEPAA